MRRYIERGISESVLGKRIIELESVVEHLSGRVVALEAAKPKTEAPRNNLSLKEREIGRCVFDAWREAFGKKRSKMRAGDKRDVKIQARLKTWDVETLVNAIKGYAFDPWRHEQPGRHELATLLRNDAQVEAGVEMFEKGAQHARTLRATGRNQRANSTIDYGDADRSPGAGNPVRSDSPKWKKVCGSDHDLREDGWRKSV